MRLAILALAAAAAGPSTSRADLTGGTLTLEYRFPDVNTVYVNEGFTPQTFVVGAGQEVTSWSQYLLSYDVADSSVTTTFGVNNGWNGSASFNGWSLTDTGNNTPNFTSVTVDPATTMAGMTNSRITFDGNHIYVNWAGLNYTTSTILKLAILSGSGGSWTGGAGDGVWATGGNWSTGAQPTSLDDATFNLNSTYTVSLSASAAANTVNIRAGTVTFATGTNNLQVTGDALLGNASAEVANLTLTGTTGSMQTGGNFNVGVDGKATFTQGSGSLSVAQAIYIARNATSAGTFNMQGGGAQAANAYLGSNGGAGTLNLSGGSLTVTGLTKTYATGSMIISGGSLTTGTLDAAGAAAFNQTGGTITVSGGQWLPKLGSFPVNFDTIPDTAVNSFAISGAGGSEAAFRLVGGATLTSGADALYVGHSGNKGRFILDAGVATLTQSIDVGAGRNSAGTTAAEGTLALSNGGRLTVSTLGISDNGGKGTATVDGASTLSASNTYIGSGIFNNTYASEGTLNLTNGGRINAGTARVGYSGGKGFVGVNGGTFTASNLYVGYSSIGALIAAGTLSANNGGSLSTSHAHIGSALGTGTLLLSGSNTRWTNTGSVNIGNDSTGTSAGTGYLSLASDAMITNAGQVRVYAGGTLSVSGGTLTTHDLDASAAGGYSFTGGTITVSGGQWKPKLTTVAVNLFPAATNIPNSFDVNGAGGVEADFNLLAGASFSTSGTNQLFVGHSGQKGRLAIDFSSGTLSGTGVVRVGAGRNSAGTTPAEGTLAISGAGRIVSVNVIEVGLYGGKGSASVDGNSTLTTSNSLNVGINLFNGSSPAQGTLSLTNGGHAVAISTSVGSTGGSGSLSIDGGTLSTQTLLVGYNQASSIASVGSLSAINGGSINTTSGTTIGYSTGRGTVSLSGNNTRWNSATDINVGNDGTGNVLTGGSGTLSLTNSARLTNNGTVKVYSGGRLQLASGATLQTGTLNLTSNAGNFDWTGGTLKINTQAPLVDGLLTIPNTGTLGGVGDVQRPVTASAGGTLAPGNSAGTIKTGALTLDTGSTYFLEVDINANNADKAQVTGTVDLSGVDNGLGGTVGGANLEFVLLSGTYPLASPKTYIIIDNDLVDPIAGVFNGLIENMSYNRQGVEFSVNYHAGTGNDVSVTFTQVPEPASMGALLAIGGLLIGRRRRLRVA